MAGMPYGGSPAMMKTPMGAVVLVEALGAVGLARGVKNQCGDERGRVQELEDPFWRTTGPGRLHI
jgi:hypothetical protein